MAFRALKKKTLALLQSDDFDHALEILCGMPARQVVNPLFGLLYHHDPLTRWRAVAGMGVVVSALAGDELESARVIMRRFMWNLNDESGGIGWGSPEAMADIMARSRKLADEYGCLILSYADPEGNYLEHPTLQYGVLWAIGRMARVWPKMMQPAANLLRPWLQSTDPTHRGLAAWAAAPIMSHTLESHLIPLQNDPHRVEIFLDHHLVVHRLADLAVAALASQTT